MKSPRPAPGSDEFKPLGVIVVLSSIANEHGAWGGGASGDGGGQAAREARAAAMRWRQRRWVAGVAGEFDSSFDEAGAAATQLRSAAPGGLKVASTAGCSREPRLERSSVEAAAAVAGLDEIDLVAIVDRVAQIPWLHLKLVIAAAQVRQLQDRANLVAAMPGHCLWDSCRPVLAPSRGADTVECTRYGPCAPRRRRLSALGPRRPAVLSVGADKRATTRRSRLVLPLTIAAHRTR